MALTVLHGIVAACGTGFLCAFTAWLWVTPEMFIVHFRRISAMMLLSVCLLFPSLHYPICVYIRVDIAYLVFPAWVWLSVDFFRVDIAHKLFFPRWILTIYWLFLCGYCLYVGFFLYGYCLSLSFVSVDIVYLWVFVCGDIAYLIFSRVNIVYLLVTSIWILPTCIFPC
jgi:hypothetical protein